MLKAIATDVVISRGYDNAPAIRYTETENGGTMARFRVGKRTYDPQTKENSRWINLSIKAFGPVCERMKKMALKEGSYVNLLGRLDEDAWTDQKTGEKKSMMVIVLDEIEYASGAPRSKDEQKSEPQTAHNAPPASAAQPPQDSENFTGYEPFGTGSFFDEN